jgi:hypothetical protein
MSELRRSGTSVASIVLFEMSRSYGAKRILWSAVAINIVLLWSKENFRSAIGVRSLTFLFRNRKLKFER